MSHILIGLGGTGGKILKSFRQRLWTNFSKEERDLLKIGFIYVDSDRSMIDPTDMSYETIHGNCCFENQDFVDIKTHSDIDAIFANSKAYPRLAGLLGNVGDTQASVGSIGAAAEQKRRAGRLLFAANIDAYVAKFAQVVNQLNSHGTNNSEQLNIYIFAGLAGGTGSGCIVDTVAQTRKWLFEHNYGSDKFNLVSFCQLPEDEPQPNWDTGRYKANGYGALLELNNLMCSHYNQKWKDEGCKPAYDVTSQVDFGRMYLSYENPTPENVQKGRIPHELKIADGLILYTNKNSSGFTITEPVALAQVVADFVYSWIFTPGGDAKNEFGRFVSFENIDMVNRDEMDENVNSELADPLPVRTRALGSFGIKRIVVPEADIQEYISYSTGCVALSLLEFNNWSEEAGCLRRLHNFDSSSYVRDPARRKTWKLALEHFLLHNYILESDRKEGWPEGTFSTYWTPCIDAWAESAAKVDDSFNKLLNFCRGGFKSGFRGKGVENFFKDKASVIDEAYSKEIVRVVENYLFKRWGGGEGENLSLATLEDISLKLTQDIKKQTAAFCEDIPHDIEQNIEKLENEISMIIKDYLDSNVLKRPLIFKNRFKRVVELCKRLYSLKTDLAAVRLFSEHLSRSLEGRFSDLHERIVKFREQISKMYDHALAHQSTLLDLQLEDHIHDRDGLEKINQTTISFYKRKRLIELNDGICHNREMMDTVCQCVRTALVKGLKSDGRFVNQDKLNGDVLPAVLLGPVYNQISSFHEKLCQEDNSKVLDIPILKRLYHKFGGEQLALNKFASDLVMASDAFLGLDKNQVQLKCANNSIPQLGKNMLFRRILINLPKCEDPELLAFSKALKNAILAAIPGGDNASIVVDSNNPDTNEISVLVLCNCFPMRAIKSLPSIKAKFDSLIAADTKNKILLVTEGVPSEFPDLFALPPKTVEQIRDEVVPKLIVSLGLGSFKQDPASEEYGPCEKDFFGNASVTPWGHRSFVDIPFDDRLIEERETAIHQLYNKSISEAFQSVDISVRSQVEAKKLQIEADLMAEIKTIMASVSQNSVQYKEFIKWTKAAVSLVEEYKPVLE